MMKLLLYLFFIVTCYATSAQEDQVSSAVDTFMSTRTYSEKKAALHINVDQHIVASIIYLIENSPHLFFQQRLFYFLIEMKDKGDLNDQEYVSVLSRMVNNPILGDRVLERLGSYVTDESSMAAMQLDSSVLTQTHVELSFLAAHLRKNICNDFVVSVIPKVVKNSTLDIRDRSKLLGSFLSSCNTHKDFITVSLSFVTEENLEWPLKEKVFLSNPYFVCTSIDHLLSLFFENKRLHIRDDIIWILADIGTEDCDQDTVVSFFIDLIERDPDQMSADLSEFRETMIRSPLWALVRIGIKNKNEDVVVKLKVVAMNYNLSPYFRARAVEALQDLSIYFESAARSLYEIIRDNKRVVVTSDFLTEAQRIRDEEDAQIRYSAFVALEELLGFDRSEKLVITRKDFLPFLYSGYEEKPDSDEVYRQKAFAGLQVPGLLDIYARPALIGMVNDSQVEEPYRTEAAVLLQRLP